MSTRTEVIEALPTLQAWTGAKEVEHVHSTTLVALRNGAAGIRGVCSVDHGQRDSVDQRHPLGGAPRTPAVP